MIRNAFNEIKLFIFFYQIFDWPTKGGVAELRVLSITSANSSDPIRPLRCVCLFKLYGKDKKNNNCIMRASAHQVSAPLLVS